ncbi:MAG: hypothetical protein AB7E95_08240 [Kiritimatiellales bacterium]
MKNGRLSHELVFLSLGAGHLRASLFSVWPLIFIFIESFHTGDFFFVGGFPTF